MWSRYATRARSFRTRSRRRSSSSNRCSSHRPIIRSSCPGPESPLVAYPAGVIEMRVPVALLCRAVVCLMWWSATAAQTPADTGRQAFVGRCASCHGSDGNGGELGPGIATRVPSRTDQELTTLLRQGLPSAGMPAFSSLSSTETADLIRYLRTLKARNGSGPVRTSAVIAGGRAIAGLVLNHTTDDLQLLGDDRKIHLLRRSGEHYRVVTSQAD